MHGCSSSIPLYQCSNCSHHNETNRSLAIRDSSKVDLSMTIVCTQGVHLQPKEKSKKESDKSRKSKLLPETKKKSDESKASERDDEVTKR
jgi:hypothetical protein